MVETVMKMDFKRLLHLFMSDQKSRVDQDQDEEEGELLC